MNNPSARTKTVSHQAAELRQSGIRASSTHCARIGGINLGQGVCDIPTQEGIKQAASQAIFDDKNLYAPCEGVLALREKLADKIQQFNHVTVDPQTEVLVTHGATGAFICAAKTLLNPGDSALLFEPFYGYHQHIFELFGIKTHSVPISMEDYQIDFDRLEATITASTRAIVICTPCNPSGKVFSREELMRIGELAEKHDLFIITDEIYEYITYPGFEHVSIASLANYKQRTVTISGFSKTYNITGWRLGYAYGPAWIIEKMALVHDLFYICPPTPLQHAMLAALQLKPSYYDSMRADFLHKRDLLVDGLRKLRFSVSVPQGAYYLLANFQALGFEDDDAAASVILENTKVAAVPGHSFYQHSQAGCQQIRFCFALSEAKIRAALEQMTSFFRRNYANPL